MFCLHACVGRRLPPRLQGHPRPTAACGMHKLTAEGQSGFLLGPSEKTRLFLSCPQPAPRESERERERDSLGLRAVLVAKWFGRGRVRACILQASVVSAWGAGRFPFRYACIGREFEMLEDLLSRRVRVVGSPSNVFLSFLYSPLCPVQSSLAFCVCLFPQTKATFLKLAGPQLVQMFIGDGAKMVRDAFELAKEKSPAIIFIGQFVVSRH